MSLFYSYKYYKNFSLILISIILFLFLFSFSSIKSEEIGLFSEKALFNESLINFNKTIINFEHIKNKMLNIKFNVILLVKHKNLIRVYHSINSEIGKIKTELDKNKYDKDKIIEEIQTLNSTILKFETKCNEMMHTIQGFEKNKKMLLNTIKIFFIILLIIIIIAVFIIGIVSFFVIKSQRKYHILHEEKSQDNIDVENGKNYNNELNRIKAKIGEEDSTDRIKIISNESNEDKKTELQSSN